MGGSADIFLLINMIPENTLDMLFFDLRLFYGIFPKRFPVADKLCVPVLLQSIKTFPLSAAPLLDGHSLGGDVAPMLGVRFFL